MASTYETDPSLSDLPRRELEELRQGLLLGYMSALLTIVVAWLLYLSWRNRVVSSLDAAVVIAALCSCLAYVLRERRHTAACWLFLLGLVCGETLITYVAPDGLTMAFGIVVVIVAYALLDARQALAAMILTWGASALAWHMAMADASTASPVLVVAILHILTWGATVIAGRPLHRSVEIALTGWSQLRTALLETRERRAEMYRVVRALEEATYRIQRMNNELLLARQSAEAARASKARFASIVSHELRGPLNLILGFSRLMALSPESYRTDLPDAYRADVDTVYENSQHLVSLLDDILDLSGMEVEQIPLTKERIDLQGDVIEDTVRAIRLLAAHRALELHVEMDGDLPPILADKGRLRQVLLNLLTNAIRFTERGGITIRTALRADEIQVSVQDTGRGIAPDQLPRLFQEFQQLHTGSEQELKGTGLGLAISKYIVELHGGQIWAESTEGKGTTIYFTLPWRYQEQPHAGMVRTSESPGARGTYETCLVVHDDPLVVRLLARHIKNYHIVGLAKEEEALALTDQLHPKAIITADNVAGKLLERLAVASLDVPVLSCALPHLTWSPVEGAMMFLMKPIAIEMLTAAMKQVEHGDETTVLLVDDDRDAVRLLESMLRVLPRPYRIHRAYSGLQALKVMRDVLPDVVFMDLVMPEMSGQETIARMRADVQLREIPVIIISARDADDHTAALGTSLTLQYRQPISVSKGTIYLQALLDAVSPSYLPGPIATESPPADSPERSASPGPPTLPGSAPG